MTPTGTADEITPFSIDVPATALDDLRDRLGRTRWPDAIADDWDRGTAPGALRTLVDHWRTDFDWPAQQTRINQQSQFRTTIEGQLLHFVRAGSASGTPLLLVHGWPDSFLRFEDLTPLLSNDFDLVVPSIPGYGFSGRPDVPGVDPARIADLFAELMTRLGFDRFAVHGGDLGSNIGQQLALRHPDRLIGLHLTDIPYWHLFSVDQSTLSPDEQHYLQRGMQWYQQEGSYAAQQGSKPQSLAYGLNDSPAGLAGWFLEKFQSWSDCNGDVFSRFSPDRLATNLTIYWVTETAGSAARLYYDTQRQDPSQQSGRVEVPTAGAIFPKDLVPAPRVFAERWFNLTRWTEMPKGGHFAAWEEPELLAADIIEFFLKDV